MPLNFYDFRIVTVFDLRIQNHDPAQRAVGWRDSHNERPQRLQKIIPLATDTRNADNEFG